MTIRRDCPPDDVVEISIFGPGLGECCLLHLGWNEWIIVDSCIDQRTGAHPALSYLSDIDVSPESVKLVVATHAHNDHNAGISNVVSACINADFVVSAATSEEFFGLLMVDRKISGVVRQSAYDEYRKAQAVLAARARNSGRGRGVPAYRRALADRPIYRRTETADHRAANVIALSPSDEAVTKAGQYVTSLYPVPGEPPRRLAPPDPNTLAVALWVEVGDTSLLLGSDLTRGPGKNSGWAAVLGSSMKPSSKAEVFKIPHHGSPNAHHEDVWSQMLVENCVALVAPYRAGVTLRPSLDDAKRICNLTDRAYVSARPTLPAQSAKLRRAASGLATLARSIHEVEGIPGQVRARKNLAEGDWRIDVQKPAVKLEHAYEVTIRD
ncbi:MBL fold metallo-hydrolase [Frankia sp. BMG5.23]|uniref:MBL fold metallo-hydrolase n=1 Tax=Frankia sp. BMG5.23 TaxID=683305 RepID=UPI0013664FE1|nr:MBL fold metallo-hydrolase [Frankia sp. BMG5.23]